MILILIFLIPLVTGNSDVVNREIFNVFSALNDIHSENIERVLDSNISKGCQDHLKEYWSGLTSGKGWALSSKF